jgi:hypothetical protein
MGKNATDDCCDIFLSKQKKNTSLRARKFRVNAFKNTRIFGT